MYNTYPTLTKKKEKKTESNNTNVKKKNPVKYTTSCEKWNEKQ